MVATLSFHRTTLLLLLSTLSVTDTRAQTQVYRCQGENGVTFSDAPCGPNPETIRIRDNRVGGSLSDHLPDFANEPEPMAPSQPAPEANPRPDSCRHINSTRLRTYLARNQVVPGMTRQQVERAFGRTSETYSSPQETWVYQSRQYGAVYQLTYVYFRNGCVESVEYRAP